MTLESRALAQFDRLVNQKELFWAEAPPRHVPSKPFSLQVRVTEILKKKPWTSRQKKVDNAFADEDPDFNLGQIGTIHKLILNKFSVVRPQFVLPTIEFESQNDPLTAADLGAAWEVLSSLESEYMIIFNCGADGGASVGHKHLQVLPCPDPKEHTLFPETNLLNEGISEVIEVPYRHAIQKLPEDVTAEVLSKIYQHLFQYCSLQQGSPHNFICTRRWMMIIPRTMARVGELSANAAAMLGMVWVTSEEDYTLWTAQDPMLLLKEFGVARDGA